MGMPIMVKIWYDYFSLTHAIILRTLHTWTVKGTHNFVVHVH